MKIFAKVVHTNGVESISEVFGDHFKELTLQRVIETNVKVIVVKTNGMKIEYSLDEFELE